MIFKTLQGIFIFITLINVRCGHYIKTKIIEILGYQATYTERNNRETLKKRMMRAILFFFLIFFVNNFNRVEPDGKSDENSSINDKLVNLIDACV